MFLVSIALSALVVLFLIADAGLNLFAPHLLADAHAHVGFPSELSKIIGGIMIACAIVYAIPKTATLGAILITAFAGGAICAHFRIGEIGSLPQLISLALAVVAWLSLWLRDQNLREALGFRG
jgi:hypothetical protein